jgi:fused signal recognition particle receptor
VDWVFWVIVAGIVAATAVAYVAVRFGRRVQQVEPGAEPAALADATPDVSVADGEAEKPVATTTADEAASQAVAELDTPEAPAARLTRLRRRLAGSQNNLARALGDLLSVDKIDDDTWDDFEATLIASDLGVGPTNELVESLRKALAVGGVSDSASARRVLRSELIKIVGPEMDRELTLDHAPQLPAVVMMVGVNGTGKTTTVGKLGRMLVAQDKTVLFGAADTFRAAAAEQLTTWGERVGVNTVRSEEGADPASVAFNAVEQGITEGVDVVLVDTAGRLHTKVGLMDELGKVKRVIEKKAPVGEVLLVIDATTGQNGLTQARIFSEVVNITGVVLTKLDGSAKGGIVVQVQRELGVPVKFIGLGEGPDDLAPFDAEQFVDGLLGD